jgi:hypothetical protein
MSGGAENLSGTVIMLLGTIQEYGQVSDVFPNYLQVNVDMLVLPVVSVPGYHL